MLTDSRYLPEIPGLSTFFPRCDNPEPEPGRAQARHTPGKEGQPPPSPQSKKDTLSADPRAHPQRAYFYFFIIMSFYHSGETAKSGLMAGGWTPDPSAPT